MAVDDKIIAALSEAVGALQRDAPRPLPAGAVAALADIAVPGTRVRIDMAATAAIGVPLITVEQSRDDTAVFAALTRRQREVADLIVQGQSNKDIALSLGISVATVKDHVHGILQRLQLPSRVAVMAAARF
ncbi:LuxR C-terminal-related transcriptional regulator [Loktanella sp. Alg231-35]|uniref:LuxR C-terminal-related transcriptional regulator n=1 Tax=Loktanella sp. Alg231-35 TaxID=1922220 RepID=UPI000D54EA6C|nr:LuxR C-terminal-related transcriptional regulator [Loktanella sp. Alg231-35]